MISATVSVRAESAITIVAETELSTKATAIRSRLAMFFVKSTSEATMLAEARGKCESEVDKAQAENAASTPKTFPHKIAYYGHFLLARDGVIFNELAPRNLQAHFFELAHLCLHLRERNEIVEGAVCN